MKAIIPAAGIGTRLRPHTHTAPKALLHVAGKPILGHILDEVRAYGIRDIVIIIGFMGDQIVEYVRKNYPAVNATFVTQEELKGLGWAIYLAREHFQKEPILIILGDTIFETDLNKVINGEYDSIGTKTVEDPRRFGIAETDGQFVTALTEKPEHPTSNLALVGIYYIKSTELFTKSLNELVEKDIKTRGEYQLTDALSLMLRKGAKITTFNVEGWFDCGKPDALLATNRYLLSLIKSTDHREGNVIIPPVFISPSAVLEHSVVGPFVSVGDNSRIIRSIVKDSIISESAEVIDSVLDSSLVGNNSSLSGHYQKVNLGDSSEIGY
ncbi:MAG TPA: nucleotidyl transferase [candidate division Zixibacteria bacterium]|nr:nucleotidyl transferase [candidate division Zixibacteria bacterium]HBY99812.1 nucleotidyl transferase [candidate division Zixibacteria bacterium]